MGLHQEARRIVCPLSLSLSLSLSLCLRYSKKRLQGLPLLLSLDMRLQQTPLHLLSPDSIRLHNVSETACVHERLRDRVQTAVKINRDARNEINASPTQTQPPNRIAGASQNLQRRKRIVDAPNRPV